MNSKQKDQRRKELTHEKEQLQKLQKGISTDPSMRTQLLKQIQELEELIIDLS